METRKIPDISSFNALGMWEFVLIKFEDDILIIQAHQGYPKQYWAEIKFVGVEHISCPIYFFDARLRKAVEYETPLMQKHKTVNLYCFETPATPGKEAEKFYVAAWEMDIVVYYGDDNLLQLLQTDDGQQVESQV